MTNKGKKNKTIKHKLSPSQKLVCHDCERLETFPDPNYTEYWCNRHRDFIDDISKCKINDKKSADLKM